MAELHQTAIINAGSASLIPPGQGRCYVVRSIEVAVFRKRDGSLFALQNRCPHRNGPLSEGLVGHDRVLCPLHGHGFDLQSGSGTEPGEHVRVLDVREVGGAIVLAMPTGEQEATPLECETADQS